MEIDFLKRIVKEAEKISHKNREVHEKDDKGDLVTNLDLEIEKYLIEDITPILISSARNIIPTEKSPIIVSLSILSTGPLISPTVYLYGASKSPVVKMARQLLV